MKRIVLLLATLTALSGCANTAKQNDVLQKQIEQLELNQRFLAARLQMTNSIMPTAINFDSGITIGDINAPYVMIEFTDLQCPYCGTFQKDVFPEFKKQYIDSGKVLFVAREFPLKQIHPNATEAAIALRCVDKQNSNEYSKFKAAVFKNKDNLSQDFYANEVLKMELSKSEFNQCMNSKEQLNTVNNSYKYAVGIGLNSTPSFIFGKNTGKSAINYKIAKGGLSMDKIEQALNAIK